MGNIRLRHFLLVSLAAAALFVGACTRSASTPPPDSNIQTEGSGEVSGQQGTMEAVRAALLTQNADSATGGSLGPTSTFTPSPEAPTATNEASSNNPTASATLAVVVNTPTPRPNQGATQEYTVQAGDWVYSVARQFGVDPEVIIAENNLQAPYTLETGQVLKIPTGGSAGDGPTNTPTSGGTEYTVQAGDWVYSIGRKFGVEPLDIIATNNLQYPYTLYPGDVLTIP
jgi:LysM repeat protein